MCIRTQDDLERLKEVLFGYKRYFQYANNLKDSTVELTDVSAISKVQVLLHFKLMGEHLDTEGFHIRFEANYASSVEAIVTAVTRKISEYTDNLSAVFSNLQTCTPSDIQWWLCGDGEMYFFSCYKKRLCGGHATYSTQFGQTSVLDVRNMTDLCSKCIDNCLKL